MIPEATDKEKIEACLLEILGSVIKAESWKYRCSKCKVQMECWEDLDPHHITYVPSVVKYLCPQCHYRITYLNGLKARKLGRKLNNKDRWAVWKKFLKEKTTDQEYELSRDIVESWFN